ncbi:MAG: sulfite exporter TauE/SafE family protein, partial [Dokdonella sp.]
LDIEFVRRGLRVMTAVALILAALSVLGRAHGYGFGIGAYVWQRLAPLGRRLLPVSSIPRALGFGMIWGWMPCGFVYSVLLIAAAQMNPWRAAATMTAFGLGTLPAMLATSASARRIVGLSAGPTGKRIAAGALVVAAILTAMAPWMMASSHWLHAWMPFDCFAD